MEEEERYCVLPKEQASLYSGGIHSHASSPIRGKKNRLLRFESKVCFSPSILRFLNSVQLFNRFDIGQSEDAGDDLTKMLAGAVFADDRRYAQ